MNDTSTVNSAIPSVQGVSALNKRDPRACAFCEFAEVVDDVGNLVNANHSAQAEPRA